MAFNFMDFAAAQTAGQQINLDLQSKRNEQELQKQKLEAGKFQLQQQMQAQQQQQAFQQKQAAIVADYDQTHQAQREHAGEDPDAQAEQQGQSEVEMYRKIGQAALTTNPAAADQYFKMADAAQGKLVDQKKKNLEIIEKKTKDIGAFAGAVLAGTVSPSEAFDYVKKTSGLKDAMEIPADPEKAKLYWQTKQKQGLSAQEQASNDLKVQELEERKRADKQREADHREDQATRRAEVAQRREDSNFFKTENLKLRGEANTRANAGGAIERRQTIAAVNYANETARGLDLVASMGAKQTVGVFAHMQDGTSILKSLEQTGTNKLTPELQQIYQTATKGLGLELAQLATAGSGRAPVQSVIRELSAMVEARPGDKEFEVMFKLANAADFAKVRLEAVPASSDPKIQAIREKAERALERYPHPGDILKLAQAKGVKLDKAQKQVEKLQTMKQSMEASVGGSETPSDINSLLDKYK